MVFIGGGEGLNNILYIKIKSRLDDFSDQFSRIFLMKMFVISAFVTSIDFFSDRVSCMVDPERMSEEFVHSVCWIQGRLFARTHARTHVAHARSYVWSMLQQVAITRTLIRTLHDYIMWLFRIRA